ncbi:MAG: 2-amino-4-hydroxy-6-hydroxymethyldihydropteridine diphosphokinase [Desulfobulbaceae bacterium]|nr:2-amino-4-hydroxy-6-hydroxymethyldihydropteridine diphosphokinase [Desulfobulbaceae bacterium]
MKYTGQPKTCYDGRGFVQALTLPSYSSSMNGFNGQHITCCIGLGSNLGNSLQILQDSWQRLGEQNDINLQALSAPYRTEPVDMESEHWFINAAGLLTTALSPEALLDQLLRVEQEFGRRRDPHNSGYQDRTLDLDVLLYGDLRIGTSRLQIPHPEMHKRLFVLVPLADLAPNRLHPRFQCSLDELKLQLMDEKSPSIPEQMLWTAAEND